MAKHIVKCPKCGQDFDMNSVQAVRVSARRYGHATCYPNNTDFMPLVEKTEENEDLKKVKDYISKVYGNKANWPLIMRQIKKFTTEKGYSLSGILKSLIWFYDIQHNNVDGSNGGIGIVEYAYQPAYNYYLALFIAQQANENKTLFNEVKEVTITPPEMRGTKQKLIDFGEWIDEEQ